VREVPGRFCPGEVGRQVLLGRLPRAGVAGAEGAEGGVTERLPEFMAAGMPRGEEMSTVDNSSGEPARAWLRTCGSEPPKRGSGATLAPVRLLRPFREVDRV
jgi:hypothetical protein